MFLVSQVDRVRTKKTTNANNLNFLMNKPYLVIN